MGVYILDSNFFIEAHRANYPLDVFPSFWLKVKSLADDGKIISIDKVKHEIYKNEDELKIWCQSNLPVSFFKDSAAVIQEYSEVVGWAASKNGHYSQKALNEFLDADEADAWLIAFALANGDTIITHEISNPAQKSKIKIPEGCIHLSVKFLKPIEMFRELNERF